MQDLAIDRNVISIPKMILQMPSADVLAIATPTILAISKLANLTISAKNVHFFKLVMELCHF
jgi:hypothetical protein